MGIGGEVGALEGAILIDVVGVVVVVIVTGLNVVWGLKQPAVLETSSTTRSDHAPSYIHRCKKNEGITAGASNSTSKCKLQ